jgi:hypothetical protein
VYEENKHNKKNQFDVTLHGISDASVWGDPHELDN